MSVSCRGWRTTYAFDTLGRATTVSYQDGSTVTFAYDSASRRTGATDASGVTTWTYDALARPTVVNNPGGRRVSLAYDSGGRRSTLTEPGGGVFTYAFDSASKLTGVQNPQGERTTWAYDSLSRVSTLTYANTATVTYSYDAASRTTGVRNAKSDGTAIAGFVYTSSLGAYGNVVSQRRSSTTSYLHPDHLGTIWSVSASDQSTSDTYLFDAWGKQLASSGSTVNPHRYVGARGYYTEPSLSLNYVRARWLRPSTGSWLSVDPVPGQTRYGHTGGSPLSGTDPTGTLLFMGGYSDIVAGAWVSIGAYHVRMGQTVECGLAAFSVHIDMWISVGGGPYGGVSVSVGQAYADIPVFCDVNGPGGDVQPGDKLALGGFGLVGAALRPTSLTAKVPLPTSLAWLAKNKLFGLGGQFQFLFAPNDAFRLLNPDWWMVLFGVSFGTVSAGTLGLEVATVTLEVKPARRRVPVPGGSPGWPSGPCASMAPCPDAPMRPGSPAGPGYSASVAPAAYVSTGRRPAGP